MPLIEGSTNSQHRWFVPVILIAVTLTALAPVLSNEFLSWDDSINIWSNPDLNPPTVNSIAKYWVRPARSLYIPVTYAVWGALSAVARGSPDTNGVSLNPAVFHAASVAVHVFSVLLVYVILMRLIADRTAATIGALLFGIHPVQVESVAWAAGLKDVLSGALVLTAVWQYVVYLQRGGRRHFAAATGAFVFAMLAKPSAMGAPLIAFALDYWLLRRDGRLALKTLGPWFVLSVACAIVARLAQPATSVTAAPLWARPFVAAGSLSFYFGKLIWPVHLCIDYGHRPAAVMGQWWFYVSWLLPVAIALWLIANRKRRPHLVVAGIAFVVGVAPVLGLVTFEFQFYSTTADHYLYVSMLGAAVAAAWLLANHRGGVLRTACIIVLILLGVRTFLQTRVWKNNERLYSHTLALNPQSFMAMNNLSQVYRTAGQYETADRLLRGALQIFPDYPEAHYNLGLLLEETGDQPTAIQRYRHAIRLNPALPEVHNSLGNALADQGQRDQAIAHFETAIQLNPDFADARFNLGHVLLEVHQPARAVEQFQQVVRLTPNDAEAHGGLAIAFAQMDEREKAILEANTALEVAERTNRPATAAKIRAWLHDYRAKISIPATTQMK